MFYNVSLHTVCISFTPFTSILHLFGVTQNGFSHSFLFLNLYSTFFKDCACGLICIDICFYLCFFFFVAAITIRRWKYKRVPVTIVSMYCSTLQIYCPLFTSISVFLLCVCVFVFAWLYSWSCSVVWTNCVNSLKGLSGWVGAYTHQIPLNLSLYPGFQGGYFSFPFPSSLYL